MDSGNPMPQMTRAEQETETEASRLTTQIERAMTAVALRSESDREELEACADSLERSARNLVAALRELADERKRQQDESVE
jgi:hypothetical protein